MIDLRSDTLSLPTAEMLQAILQAPLGDDGRVTKNGRGEDPTVRELEDTMAALTGKEGALFCNSGTMGNTAALLTWCRPHDTVLADSLQHLYKSEKAAFSSRFGQLEAVHYDSDEAGLPDRSQIKKALDTQNISLLCVENTHNFKGGKCIPPAVLQEIYDMAKAKNVPVHMDGARLWNAMEYLGVSAKDLCQYADTVMICLSKGLGAPIGSVLCGPKEFIEEARATRKLLGGNMRQAGIAAAPALQAIRTWRETAGADNANARSCAEKLAGLKKAACYGQAQTNILMLDITGTGLSAEEYCGRAKKKGLWIRPILPGFVRLVFYRGISREQALQAADILLELDQEV